MFRYKRLLLAKKKVRDYFGLMSSFNLIRKNIFNIFQEKKKMPNSFLVKEKSR